MGFYNDNANIISKYSMLYLLFVISPDLSWKVFSTDLSFHFSAYKEFAHHNVVNLSEGNPSVFPGIALRLSHLIILFEQRVEAEMTKSDNNAAF